MRDLFFNSPEDFEDLFSRQSRKVTDLIFESIGEGIKQKRSSVTVFTINIGDDDFKYEITLPKSQWKGALKTCLDNYQRWECTDEIIDTYLLIKELKKWGIKQS